MVQSNYDFRQHRVELHGALRWRTPIYHGIQAQVVAVGALVGRPLGDAAVALADDIH
jgi:hypothetical protein